MSERPPCLHRPFGFGIGKRFTVLVAIVLSCQFSAHSQPPSEGARRVAVARKDHGAEVRAAITEAGLHYPPRELFLRVFKFENTLEIWARDADSEPFKSVLTLPLADVRTRGRKQREGDYFTPEGFYRITDFNPESAGYLSLRLDYPNAADRIHAGARNPGGQIFIHGGGYSTGCIPLTIAGISQLYLLALDTQRRPISVHIFPHRLDRTAEEVASAPLTRGDPSIENFWAELRPAYDAFERTKRVPQIRITKDGHYALVPLAR